MTSPLYKGIILPFCLGIIFSFSLMPFVGQAQNLTCVGDYYNGPPINGSCPQRSLPLVKNANGTASIPPGGLAGIVNSVISVANVAIYMLSGVALVLFLFGVANHVRAVSAGSKNQDKGIFWWGIIALFVLFSLWGIINVLKLSFFGA